MKMFMSDNNSGVHSRIIERIAEENMGHNYSYGTDKTTEEAEALIGELLGSDVRVYFTTTGTATNIIGLSGLLRPYEAVVACDTAHINVDECGALERFSGSKILTVPNDNGKLNIEYVKPYLLSLGDHHQSQPKVISISQTTEKGSLYSLEEIRKIADFAHENGMYLHVDGARISNAIVALNSSYKEMITDTGVDLFSFGGTKNGMMIGEAIVVLNQEIGDHYGFMRKQGMQLVSKMRFVTCQFIPYIKENIWYENAKNANEMGIYFRDELMKIPGVSMVDKVETNMLFVKMPKDKIGILESKFDFYVMDEDEGIIRLVTSFDTTREDIDKFISEIK